MKIFTKITSILLVVLFGITQFSFTTLAQNNDITFTDLSVEVLDDARVYISWNTNYPAYYLLEYGPTSDYGNSIRGTESRSNQQVILKNLASKKLYHFRIIAYTNDGKRTVTFDQIFKSTKKLDDTKPKILHFSIPLITKNSAYLQIQTDEKTTTYITYWNIEKSKKKRTKKISSRNENWAYGTIKSLRPSTTYAYEIKIKDKNNNTTILNEKTFRTESSSFEINDLKITNISPIDHNSKLISENQITVNFKTTLPARCEVINKKQSSRRKAVYKEPYYKQWNHSLTLDKLQMNTKYSYQIKCIDFQNKKITSQWFNYKTKGPVVLGYSTLTKPFEGKSFVLMRAKNDEKIYAVFQKQKYHIKNPATLKSYGLENEPIKIVSPEQLESYVDARIVKDISTNEKYFLYLDIGRKKKINSDKVNRSYSFNRKYKAIPINNFDLQNYPDITLIKEKNNPAVYVIYGNKKRPILSWDVFVSRGWQAWEIGIVNKTDLDSYTLGEPLR